MRKNVAGRQMFHVKQGDTRNPLSVQLYNENGIINLQGATVRFLMTDWKKRNVMIDDVAITDNAFDGIVSYYFNEYQTSKVGSYFCEFEITFSDGKKETFPTQGELILVVNSSLRGTVIVNPPAELVDGGNFVTLEFESTEDGGDFTSTQEESLDGGSF